MNLASEEFGDDHLVECVNGRHGQDPQVAVEELIKEVGSFVGEANQSDDVTMMIVRYDGPKR